jgi:hypothetical protein
VVKYLKINTVDLKQNSILVLHIAMYKLVVNTLKILEATAAITNLSFTHHLHQLVVYTVLPSNLSSPAFSSRAPNTSGS